MGAFGKSKQSSEKSEQQCRHRVRKRLDLFADHKNDVSVEQNV